MEKIVENIHRFGGLAIASHVDRESFSIFSHLGFVPEGLKLDALEVSPRYSIVDVKKDFPQTRDYPLVRFSDAHRLDDICTAFVIFTGETPCVAELHNALLCKDGREVLN